MSMTAVVDTRTNTFSLDGCVPAQFRRVVPVPRSPNPLKEKFSGDELNPFLQMTAQEIAASVAAIQDAEATDALDQFRVVKALALVVADLTGKTPTQMAALVKAKYKAL